VQLDQIQTQLGNIQKGTDQVGRIATLAYAKAAAELLGWVRSGLAASAMGQACRRRASMATWSA
jgi:hypothetical protein